MEKIELNDPAMLCSGHAACPGCLDALSVRHVLAMLGPDTMAVIPPSCMAIIAGPQPYSSLKIPVYQPTLEASAAAASDSDDIDLLCLGNALPHGCGTASRPKGTAIPCCERRNPSSTS